MSTQFDKLKEIFLIAVEKETPAERAAFLDQACSGNALLRGRLEALLDANRSHLPRFFPSRDGESP